MSKVILLLVAGTVSMSNCQFDFNFPSYTRTPLGDSIDVASMKLLKQTYDAASDKNVVSSPLGVLMLLSLYASGAEGNNREEILKYLGESDYKKTFDAYSQLSQRFAAMDDNYLTIANKVLVSNKFELDDQFKNAARSYNSEVDSIDFSDLKSAVKSINDWASAHTKGKISNPVSEPDIDPQTAAALLNVIFFQGHWHVPFNASETQEKEFHLDRSNSAKKPMMHLLQSLFYHESEQLGAKMIELPYKETNFRMVIVLPNEVDGLPGVLEKAAEKGILEDVFRLQPAGADVDLDMPKFDIKSKLNLNNILPKVGVSRIFDDAAVGIVKGTGVRVDKAFQEAFVKVDEEGATAGAFTGFIAVPMSSFSRPPPSIPFKVDHPFLFAILNDDVVLFAGTYTK